MNEPYNWWWSGRLWYVQLDVPGYFRSVCGCGATREQAVDDARKEMEKIQGKQMSHIEKLEKRLATLRGVR